MGSTHQSSLFHDTATAQARGGQAAREAGTPEIPWLEQGFFLPAAASKEPQAAASSLIPMPALGTGCCVSEDAHHKMAGYTAQFTLGWGRGGGDWSVIFK